MASLPSKITTADKSQTEPYDPSKLNAQDYNELKSKVNALIEYLTAGPTATAVAVPINFRVSALSSSSIGVSWNEVLNAVGYEVQRAYNSSFTLGVSTVYSGPDLAFEDKPLDPTTTRYYRVKALGQGSFTDSLYSAPKGATTYAVAATVYNGSYATTAADYAAKCGAGTSGASVSKTATSTVSQAAADQAAKDAAIAAIVCSVEQSDTQAPNITFTTPASGATPTVGTQLILTANATDNVAVTRVDFVNGTTGVLIGQGAKNGNTYTFPYTPTVAGALQLQANAYDAAGNVQTATVTITVQAATVPNQIPVANAGSDTTIQLPTNQAVLAGSGTDSDGSIASYAWRQVTGPNSASGMPSTVQNPVVGGLMAGTYQFGLITKDDKGASSQEDFVLLTVNAAPVTGTGPTLSLSANDAVLVRIGGQSNAIGHAKVAAGKLLDPNIDVEFQRVYIMVGGAGLQKLKIGTNNQWANYLSEPAFAAEYTLAKDFEANNPVGYMVISKFGVGGTPIEAHLPGASTNYYTTKINTYDKPAIAAIAANGWTLKRIDDYWHQGENNSGDTAYASKLDTLFNAYLADGVRRSNSIVEIGGIRQGDGTSVQAQQIAWVGQNPTLRKFRNNSTLASVPEDNEHFSAASQMTMGHNLYTDLYSTSPVAGNTTPAAPTFTNFSDTDAGGTITVVPAPGISIDHIWYKLPTAGSFVKFASGASGALDVGNVGGSVQAYSEAFGSYDQSATRTSQVFTQYVATPPSSSAPDWPAGLPYVAKYSADTGLTNLVSGQGDLRTVTGDDAAQASGGSSVAQPPITANRLGTQKAWVYAAVDAGGNRITEGLAATLTFATGTIALAMTIKRTDGANNPIILGQKQQGAFYFLNNTAMPTGSWARVIIFKEGGVSKVSVNGVISSVGSWSNFPNSAVGYIFGLWSDNGYQFTGEIADIAAIDGELSTAQALSIDNALKTYHSL